VAQPAKLARMWASLFGENGVEHHAPPACRPSMLHPPYALQEWTLSRPSPARFLSTLYRLEVDALFHPRTFVW